MIVGSDTSNVAAVQHDGTPTPGWPKFTGGWTLFTPAVADLDGDGTVEVAATTREGYLFVWDRPGRRRDIQAATWHQDVAHTGRVGPLRTRFVGESSRRGERLSHLRARRRAAP